MTTTQVSSGAIRKLNKRRAMLALPPVTEATAERISGEPKANGKPQPIAKAQAPIRVSELMKRRHVKAMKTVERLIIQREETFRRLGKLDMKIRKAIRQVHRYEKLGLTEAT